VVDASHLIVFAARTAMTEPEIDRFLDRIVEVRGGNREALAGYRQMMVGGLLGDDAKVRIPHWTARQCYIALGNLLTSAALLDRGRLPDGRLRAGRLRPGARLVGPGYAAVVCCALGYRSDGDSYATLPKVRFPSAELIRPV